MYCDGGGSRVENGKLSAKNVSQSTQSSGGGILVICVKARPGVHDQVHWQKETLCEW